MLRRYAAFKEEASIYRNASEALRQFMPVIMVYGANEDGAVRDPFGNPMPPFLVMEKGEVLSEQARRTPADTAHAAQVRSRSSLLVFFQTGETKHSSHFCRSL
jgi:hypothetical protein